MVCGSEATLPLLISCMWCPRWGCHIGSEKGVHKHNDGRPAIAQVETPSGLTNEKTSSSKLHAYNWTVINSMWHGVTPAPLRGRAIVRFLNVCIAWECLLTHVCDVFGPRVLFGRRWKCWKGCSKCPFVDNSLQRYSFKHIRIHCLSGVNVSKDSFDASKCACTNNQKPKTPDI